MFMLDTCNNVERSMSVPKIIPPKQKPPICFTGTIPDSLGACKTEIASSR